MDTVAEIETSGSRQRGAGAGGRILQNLRAFFFTSATIAVLVVVQSLRLASAEPAALSAPTGGGGQSAVMLSNVFARLLGFAQFPMPVYLSLSGGEQLTA